MALNWKWSWPFPRAAGLLHMLHHTGESSRAQVVERFAGHRGAWIPSAGWSCGRLPWETEQRSDGFITQTLAVNSKNYQHEVMYSLHDSSPRSSVHDNKQGRWLNWRFSSPNFRNEKMKVQNAQVPSVDASSRRSKISQWQSSEVQSRCWDSNPQLYLSQGIEITLGLAIRFIPLNIFF